LAVFVSEEVAAKVAVLFGLRRNLYALALKAREQRLVIRVHRGHKVIISLGVTHPTNCTYVLGAGFWMCSAGVGYDAI
jgi:hypothetical protein